MKLFVFIIVGFVALCATIELPMFTENNLVCYVDKTCSIPCITAPSHIKSFTISRCAQGNMSTCAVVRIFNVSQNDHDIEGVFAFNLHDIAVSDNSTFICLSMTSDKVFIDMSHLIIYGKMVIRGFH